MTTPGESRYAIRSPKPWNDKDRTREVYGLVVHTTGSGLPARAHRDGVYVTVAATNYYQKSHGTHYVIGWAGVEGDLIQVANEQERAHGVGMKDQREAGSAWGMKVPKVLLQRWHSAWEHTGARSPLDLFPGTSANNVYVHCEMPPCVFYDGNKKIVGAEPMDTGLRFTAAQHDAVVLLACDLAERHNWPADWWWSGRLVGHEDISPITRNHRYGGWDPGWLRNTPYFDFGYVRAQIERRLV